MLRKYGVKVISALEPVSEDEGGEFYEMYLEWNAEKYSKRLSKRVRDGLDTSVANGTFCGGYLIYGYKIRKEPVAGKNDRYIKYVDIDEEAAAVIRFMFEKYASGVSLHTGQAPQKYVENNQVFSTFLHFGSKGNKGSGSTAISWKLLI